jgi:hypothetical protein
MRYSEVLDDHKHKVSLQVSKYKSDYFTLASHIKQCVTEEDSQDCTEYSRNLTHMEFLMIQKQTEKLLNIIDKVVAYNENIERDVENVSDEE